MEVSPIKSKAVVRLGYACLNMSLKDAGMRKMTQTTMLKATDQTEISNRLRELASHNLRSVSKILDWNYLKGIGFFRMSSDLFPLISSPKLETALGKALAKEYTSLEPFKPLIGEIGRKAVNYSIRLTFHPNEFACLGGENPEVVEAAMRDLRVLARLFDLMIDSPADQAGKDSYKEYFKDSVFILHGGGKYGDKAKTLERWAKVYNESPENIKNRLVVENDERNYSPMDLLPMCEKHNIPMCVDFFHQQCYEIMHPDEPKANWDDILPRTLEIWRKRDIRPKYHVSEQQPKKRLGAHSLYIDDLPQALQKYLDKEGMFDVMLECKTKDLALLKLLEKRPHLKDYLPESCKNPSKDLVKEVNGGVMPKLEELPEDEKGKNVEGEEESCCPKQMHEENKQNRERSRAKEKKPKAAPKAKKSSKSSKKTCDESCEEDDCDESSEYTPVTRSSSKKQAVKQ